MKAVGLILLGLAIGLSAFLVRDRDSGLKNLNGAPMSGISTEEFNALRQDVNLQLIAIEQRLSELANTIETLSESSAQDQGQLTQIPTTIGSRGFAEVINAIQSSDQFQDERRRRIEESGLTQDRVDWLDRRVDELAIEARRTLAEASESGRVIDSDRIAALALEPASLLRPEVGDAEYERYLKAKGWPTTVGVSRVLASSPAEKGGMQEGDEIVAYDGERVFSQLELNSLATTRSSDEFISIEILRNGQRMQLTVPGGFLGIEGQGIIRINAR